jgi:Zn-finger nucleic acid-binding protein
MKCPVCPDATLAMTNREGIEIDYCPSCRGVWLDRGELDKIIERSSLEHASPRSSLEQASPRAETYVERERPRDYDDERYREQGYHKRRRKGFLGDLFDFD